MASTAELQLNDSRQPLVRVAERSTASGLSGGDGLRFTVQRTMRSGSATEQTSGSTAGDDIEEPEQTTIIAAEGSLDDLLAEHATLAIKEVEGTLTVREVKELRMVRWAIDRSELAHNHAQLERIESMVLLQEKLGEQIRSLSQSVLRQRRDRR